MKLLLTLLFALTAITTHAQVPNWDWATRARGILVGPSDMVADGFGNIYVTGQVDSTANFGNLFIASIPSATSHNDIFLAKYNTSGDVLWLKRVGPNTGSYQNSIAADPQGNVFVTGVAIAPDSVGGVQLADTGIYIAKYTPAGDVAWVKQVKVFTNPTRRCIACDAHGNVYLTGAYQGELAIDGNTYYSLNDKDFFLIKLDANGAAVWTKIKGGASDQIGSFITSNGNDIFVTRKEWQTGEAFVMKWDTLGGDHWSGPVELPAVVAGTAADADGNVYVAEESGYLQKFDANGKLLYRKTIHFGASGRALKGVAVDNSSARNVYITGYFEKFGPQHLPSVQVDDLKLLANYQHTDFVIQLKSNGEAVNGQMIFGEDPTYTEVQAIAVDQLGNVYLTGQAGGNCTIGDQTLVMDPADVINLYLARLGTTTSVNEVSATGDGVRIYPNPSPGNVTIDLDAPSSEIILHDITGRRLRAAKLQAAQKQVSLDISDLIDGLYYLQVMSDKGATTRRVVLSR